MDGASCHNITCFSFYLNRLLVVIRVMVVVMMMVYYHHDLRLRRIRDCEAEEKNCSEQKLFHAP
jgi:hypothetical protein